MNDLVDFILRTLQSAPPELVEVLMLVAAYGGVLVFYRQFGIYGLTAFCVIAIIGANIQVLKVVQYNVFPQPVALGTVLFSSSYLAIDLITENFGTAAARRTIWIGFCCLLFHNAFMLLTLGYAPADTSAAGLETESAFKALVGPQPGLLAAGLISFLISQHLDVAIYAKVRSATAGKYLWLRNGAATIGAALVDNIVFSLLAWEVFAVKRVPFDALIFTYILGTFFLRVVIALLDTPFMYLSRRIARPRQPAGIAA
jgi:uncharacterized integral membrane protein (TIGR00697 family)